MAEATRNTSFNDLRGMVQDFLARSQRGSNTGVVVGDIRMTGVGWAWLAHNFSRPPDFEELISPPAMKEQASTNQEGEKFTR